MKVLGHQAIMIEPQPKVLLIACQQKEKLAAILATAKDPLAVVAAVHDVVARFIGPLLPARDARDARRRSSSPEERFGARLCRLGILTYITRTPQYPNRLCTVSPTPLTPMRGRTAFT
jgi:hypothetical protein